MTWKTFIKFICPFCIIITVQCKFVFGKNNQNNISITQVSQQVIPESIVSFSRKTIQEAEEKKAPELKVQGLIQLAKGYAGKADYSSAESTLNTASDIIEFLHIDSLRADHLLELGKIYQLQQNYIPALNYFHDALKICVQNKLVFKQVKTHIYLAEYYRHIGKFDLALFHIQAAYSLTDINTFPRNLVINIYNRYAAIKSETGQPDSSVYFSKMALILAREINNKHLMAVSFNEIGFVFENKNDFYQAKKYYFMAEEIWDSLGYIRNLCNVKENLGRVLKKNKQYSESIKQYQSLIQISKEQFWFDIMERGFGEISSIYLAQGEPYKAIEFLRKQHNAEISHLTILLTKEKEQFKQENTKNTNAGNIISNVEEAHPKQIPEEKKLKFIIYLLSFVVLILLLLIFFKRRMK